MSLLTGLLEAWVLDEGAGLSSAGLMGVADLALSNTNDVDVDDIWEVGGRGFCGRGIAHFSAALALGQASNAAVTVAIEAWYGGVRGRAWPDGKVQYPEGGGSAGTVSLGSLGGTGVTFHFNTFHRVYAPPPDSPVNSVQIYQGNGMGAADGVHGFRNAPPFDGEGPYVLIIEQVRTRVHGGRTRLYWPGVGQVQGDGDSDWSTNGELLTLGRAENATTILGAAIWNRTLTGAEKDGLTSMGVIEQVLTGDDPTQGVDGAGNSALLFDFPVESVWPCGDGAVLASGDGQRHTRRVHERTPRAYTVRAKLATGVEVERLRTIIQAAKGEAQVIQWRHPTDDTGPTPPWYRMRFNSLTRGEGGVGGFATVVMSRA